MGLAIVIAVVAIILIVNVAALCAGHERHGISHNVATICGGAGFFCLLGLVVAYFDAFMQVWVKRPGYEGQLVFFFLYATGVTTTGSLISTVVVAIRDYRSEA
ncbi:hypothetical protein [Marilutibacter alkalisoli]|uniref:Uncharacterized protein n=1 Tax=Marilutibacter alkalisoli TaxID=2591633 RepID=A0A514BQP1_9GAMM|nr:hypothetical protein [Lysobacter alkalisoli]QDH69710.1 hypothetical protein FKV23_06065 [Lysobacter alkalisoli]QDH69711.1 hypothetical protein FKV23_06070 [Lysobacter alkalisoli]